MKSILPIIFIVLVLTGAIVYSLAKRTLPTKPIDNLGIPANELEGKDGITPTPTIKITNPSITPTISLPSTTENTNTTKDGQAVTTGKTTVTKVTKTTVCTPVYGSADTCTEHVVVDTGAESAMFFNFAGLAYLGGLLSFVKAKTLKH